MLATVVEGRLIGINPYGQPGVEAYKKNMNAILLVDKSRQRMTQDCTRMSDFVDRGSEEHDDSIPTSREIRRSAPAFEVLDLSLSFGFLEAVYEKSLDRSNHQLREIGLKAELQVLDRRGRLPRDVISKCRRNARVRPLG